MQTNGQTWNWITSPTELGRNLIKLAFASKAPPFHSALRT